MDDKVRFVAVSLCASIFAAKRLTEVDYRSPAGMSAIADAVAKAERIVKHVESQIVSKHGNRY